MKSPLRYFILLCCSLYPFFSGAQNLPPRLDSVEQRLTGSLSAYYKRYPQEKIFLHTDQNTYLNGQTAWYKVYAMAYGKPSQLSKIVYVRLSDANGKLIKQDKLPLKNSTAYGNINLPDSLHTGWYQLQAFTSWMLNFDKEGFYYQKIYVQNIKDTVDHAFVIEKAKAYHIDFYPEGGELVDGNICNVAFSARDQNELPVKVYGDIWDDNKRVIARLNTLHDGMGRFEVEALAKSNYTAQVHFPDNSVQHIALPAVKKRGLSMRVNAIPTDEVIVKIPYNDKLHEHEDIIIAAVQNNGLSVTYPLQLSRGINVFSFKKKDFSTGILRLTIFDELGRPAAERIVFINNNDQLKLGLTEDTLSYIHRSKNTFTIHLEEPGKANISVAITDASIGTEPDDNICSYFLMSSELRGYIHQPAYYFRNNYDTLQQQLDLVMLTNGWRHFTWDAIFNAKPKPFKYAVESSQFIAGKIENYHDRDHLKIKLMLSNSDSSKYMGLIEPDSAGTFILKDYDHQGTANMFFNTLNAKNKRQPVKITFLNSGIDTVNLSADTLKSFVETRPDIKKTFIDSLTIEQNARFVSQGIKLKQVNIKEQKLTPTELLIKSHVKHLEADRAYTLDLVNTPSLPSVRFLDYIMGRFPGLQILQDPFLGPAFIYHGPSELGGGRANKPIFYIDEAQVTLDDVQNMPLQDIALIRFAPPPVWFAPLNGGAIGAFLIYTKKFGDDKNTNNRRNFEQYTFKGFSITREFSSPDYSITKPNKQPDYRTTLYWSHDLDTDDKGNIKIHFYNSDKAKKYRIIVQGIDANGHVGYLNQVF